MIAEREKKEFYKALMEKNSYYEGLFFVGVKTTGVFCRPTCPARKPRLENCEFFETAQEALLASYRPCKRCKPLSFPNHASDLVQKLIEAVEENPEKRWKTKDFAELFVDESTARRQFKKRFGMTFVAYARARRMGLAMKKIRRGEQLIEAQLSTGYESGSGFRDAFSRIMGAAPSKINNGHVLKAAWIDTKLGPMIAIADMEALYLLEFVDRRGLEREVERLRKKTKMAIIPGSTKPIRLIESELTHYFEGTLNRFETPVKFLGTPLQQETWKELLKIPAGETRSYLEIAKAVGKPKAYRAIAQANGANQLCLIVPCHRVINTNGDLGGYGGGLTRKEWLIKHEKSLATQLINARQIP